MRTGVRLFDDVGAVLRVVDLAGESLVPEVGVVAGHPVAALRRREEAADAETAKPIAESVTHCN